MGHAPDQSNIIGVPAAKGGLGADNPEIIFPQDIWRSMIYARMNTTNDSVKMPPLARNLIDTNGVNVMAGWINSLPGTPALAPPTITPNGGSYIGSVNVTLQPPDSNATIYYTLDGSLPTTNSLLYSGAFNLFSNAIVSANAFETNFAASAQFLVQPHFFTSEGFTAGNQFQLGFEGVSNDTYVLEATTNFTDWTFISTNTLTNSTFNFLDPGASNFPYRFYRVLLQ